MPTIIARIKGGLGNQLFCYAAARRLALVSNYELALDDVTGFVRDKKYCRKFMLDYFSIPIRKATPSERLEPFERYRRAFRKIISRKIAFDKRSYIEQESTQFDTRLMHLKPNREFIYLDGLWQSEAYFEDVAQTIRRDLQVIYPMAVQNKILAAEIESCNSVALHVRWFDTPGTDSVRNVEPDYYCRAIAQMEQLIVNPKYYLFSDNPDAARLRIGLSNIPLTYVSCNESVDAAICDLYLMSRCRHFVIANSTFSWWAAWLGEKKESIILAPDMRFQSKMKTSHFRSLVPERWSLV